jgi:hypothetical protein
MTDKIRCPHFHEFDGDCCPEPMVCLYERPVPRIVVPPAIVYENMKSSHMACLALLVATLSFVGLYTAVRMERHYATQDMVNQEIVAR